MDIDQLRADTPATQNIIHLNNAGASLSPLPVIECVKQHLDIEAQIGGYEAAQRCADARLGVYSSIARLIGARSDEIALVENATAAWQLAFYATRFEAGDRILTARSEYAANYVAYLQMARRTGCVIEVIPDDDSGASDARALEQMIDGRVKLISLNWIPTNGGLVNPAAAIGAVARARGIPFLLDACQAVGQMPVDVEQLKCDFLTATGRKFLRGPRGTGFLYVRRSMLEKTEPPWIDHFGAPWTAPDTYELRADARRFETWESSIALHLGLGAAAEYAMAVGLEDIDARCAELSGFLRCELNRLPGVNVMDAGEHKCAIVSFAHAGSSAQDIAAGLRDAGINVSVSVPSSTLLDSEARDLPTLVRASPHYYNTHSELERLIETLGRL